MVKLGTDYGIGKIRASQHDEKVNSKLLMQVYSLAMMHLLVKTLLEWEI